MSQRPCSNLIHHWTERVIYICVAASGGSYCFRGQVENLVAFQATGTFVVCLINLETRANLNLVAFDAPQYSFQILKTIQDWLISNHNWIYRINLYNLNDNLQGIYFHSSLRWIKVTSPWHLSPQFDKGLNLDSDSLTFNHRAFKLNCLWGNCSAVFLKFTLFPSCGKEKRKPKAGRICVYKDHDLISIRYPILQPQQGS